MIAAYDSDTNSGLSEISHLIGKVQAGFKVLPVPIVKVSGGQSRKFLRRLNWSC
jgi:hypothetical protein